MLQIEHLTKSYGAPVLKDFSYSFPEKGLFVLRGNSGSGKTTLLRLIAGLETPDDGAIQKPDQAKISVVFQEARLLPFYTLLENLMLVAPKKTKEEALAVLEKFALREAAEKYPDTLSGGMKERAAIARSLFFGGDIFLWDEPTKELDAGNAGLVIEEMKTLARAHLVICATHDPAIRGDAEIVLPQQEKRL